jgi:hypothetical protein
MNEKYRNLGDPEPLFPPFLLCFSARGVRLGLKNTPIHVRRLQIKIPQIAGLTIAKISRKLR